MATQGLVEIAGSMRSVKRTWPARIGELAYPARLALYGAITLAAYQLLYLGVQRTGAASLAAENGPLELVQVALASFGAMALGYAAWHCPAGRFGLAASACALSYAAARELDAFVETVLFDDAYKYLVGLPLLAVTATVAWTDRRRLIADSLWLVRQPQATLFVMAGFFLVSFCQTLDRPAIWQSIAGFSAAEPARLLIEESSELFAYLLLAFSGAEGALMARRLARSAADDVRAGSADSPREETRADQTRCLAA